MVNHFNIKKKEWAKDELQSALKDMGGNSYARSALDFEFDELAIKNAAGELVIDCGEEELSAYDVLLNLQARQMERFIHGFLSNKGYELDDFWDENYEERHRYLTNIFQRLYEK